MNQAFTIWLIITLPIIFVVLFLYRNTIKDIWKQSKNIKTQDQKSDAFKRFLQLLIALVVGYLIYSLFVTVF